MGEAADALGVECADLDQAMTKAMRQVGLHGTAPPLSPQDGSEDLITAALLGRIADLEAQLLETRRHSNV